MKRFPEIKRNNNIQLAVIILVLFISTSNLFGQSLKDVTFGSDETLDILTWNIEWFPKNGQTTVDSVALIIKSLDVDLLALQEIKDTVMFKTMLAGLEGYEGYLESSWFAGLAYIYKTATVEINKIYEIYTSQPYWSPFPRSPMVMEMTFKNEDFIIINNHFKCCGDGILNINDPDDEENRRLTASILLKEYIDLNFDDDNVIILGDLNDLLEDDFANNVFDPFINDYENYLFVDMAIAYGSISEWSYPNWPSHLDHILITDDLFDEFENDSSEVRTIIIDNYMDGFWQYDANISDHRPVALRLKTNPNTFGLDETEHFQQKLTIFPNPSKGMTTISFETKSSKELIEIFNISGQRIRHFNTSIGQNTIKWNAEDLPGGFYYVALKNNMRVVSIRKLVIIE